MRRLTLGSLTTLLVLSLAACGSDSDPEAGPTPAASSSTSSPGSPESSAASEAPTSTYDGVAPATGFLISGTSVTVNMPAEWTTEPLLDDSGGNGIGPDGRYVVALSNYTTATPDPSTDGLVELAQGSSSIKPPLERQADVVIAGQPAYHLAGYDKSFIRWTEDFGFYYKGDDVLIRIGTPQDLAPADREALTASVLASVKLTK